MYDWNGFQYVLALDEGGTMRQAANLLGTNATTVSRHVKRMSEVHGVMLFTMHKGGNWVITPEGKELLRLALGFREKLRKLDLSKGADVDRQPITVTSIEFMLAHYLAPHVSDILDECPDVDISLLGADRRLSLAYGEAHLALRFGRPTEGNLLASRIAGIRFRVWAPPRTQPKRWIGLQESLDWTPEMKMGHEFFGCPPSLRVSSFAAARRAAIDTGFGAIGPTAVMLADDALAPVEGTTIVERDVWSVIHESNKLNMRLVSVRDWARCAVLGTQAKMRVLRAAG